MALMQKLSLLAAILPLALTAQQLAFDIPPSPPPHSVQIDPAPLGVSIEFFAFPDYFTNLPLTTSCLNTLKDALGASPPLRIGGTTQDRAVYNSSLPTAASYTVPSPSDAPESLQFGDKFIDLASEYERSVTLGLNRRLNNISNTISAAKYAASRIQTLHALELGNEPNFFKQSDPIANNNPWTPSSDAASQISWQESVSAVLGREQLIQAGVFFGTDAFNSSELASNEQDAGTVNYIRSFSDHYYPQSSADANLSKLMDHADIGAGVAGFKGDVEAAKKLGKEFVFGETNSGGGGISPTYGAGLWILDYVMQGVILGARQLFFHQGTIGPYCWWETDVNFPFYGAYTAATVLSNASTIAQLDSGNSRYAAYAIYDMREKPVRVLVYNSDYYISGPGSRGGVSVALSGLHGNGSVAVRRLTGSSADAVLGNGTVSIAGRGFGEKCQLEGEERIERIDVIDGTGKIEVGSAEAVVVYLE